MAPTKSLHLTGELHARKVRNERQHHQHQHRDRLRTQPGRETTTEEHPFFSLPSELQSYIFRNYYFNESTRNPVVCIDSDFGYTKHRSGFTLTPVDEAILMSSNQGAAIWLNAFAEWFDQNHRVVTDAGALFFPVALFASGRSAVATHFLNSVRSQLAKSLPPGRRWDLLCPELKSGLPTQVRDLELMVEGQVRPIPGVAPPRRGIVALTRLIRLGLAPHLERLHLKFANMRTFFTTVTAVKGTLAGDPRLAGLVVIVVNGKVREELDNFFGGVSSHGTGAGKGASGSYGHWKVDAFVRVWVKAKDRGVLPESNPELAHVLPEAYGSGLRKLVLELAE